VAQSLCAATVALSVAACGGDPEVNKRKFLESGKKYYAQGNYREAIVEFRNALKEDPRFGEARYQLAEAYARDQNLARAMQEYLRAADLMPANREAQLKACRYLLLAGAFEDAKARADKVLQAHPQDVEAQLIVGHALAGLKDLDGAIREVQEAVEVDPDRSESYVSLAAIENARGRKEEAEAALKRALTLAPRSLDAHLALGYFYWNEGRRSEAEALFKSAHQIDPSARQVNQMLSTYYIATGRAAEAEPHLKKMAEDPEDSASKLQYADYLIAMRRPQEARPILDKLAAGRNRDFGPANLRIAGLLFSDGKREEAHALIKRVLEREPNDAGALLLEARLLTAESKYDEALKRARAAADADPRSAQAQFLLGRLYRLQNQRAEAVKAFNEVLRLNPRAAQAQIELAQLNLAAGRANDSVQLAEQAVRNQPRNADAHLTLARGLLVQGQIARAEPIMQQLVAVFPKSPGVLAQMGSLQLAKRDFAAARASFERAIALDAGNMEALTGLTSIDLQEKKPNDAVGRLEQRLAAAPKDSQLMLLLARTHAATGNGPKTEEVLRKAIAVDSANLQAYGMLGSLYVAQRRLDEARREFDELAKRQPRSIAAHTMVAMILDAQGRRDEAKQRYEQILSINPEAPVAANNLAWLYADRGENLDVALQLAQTAVRVLPEHPDVNDTLGWIYVKKDLASLALPPLEKSVKSSPGNPAFHYHLGVAYAKLGDGPKARTALEQALKLKSDFAGADDARRVLNELKSQEKPTR